jgi:hypothetical protein
VREPLAGESAAKFYSSKAWESFGYRDILGYRGKALFGRMKGSIMVQGMCVVLYELEELGIGNLQAEGRTEGTYQRRSVG